MSEIATASNDQKIGIGQINQAVSEIDSATQQTAALVEQAAAAAASMQEPAVDLTKIVSQFSSVIQARRYRPYLRINDEIAPQLAIRHTTSPWD
jgi:methyl-accepting chemotaxis protein III, ribose and galactose sensor receptor